MNLIVIGVTISVDHLVAAAPLSLICLDGVRFDILGLSSVDKDSCRVATASLDFFKCLGALAMPLLNHEELVSRDQASLSLGGSSGEFPPGRSTGDAFPPWTFHLSQH
eukprot:4232619-Ditylum_brightwellii.AAC.1